jgi:arylsulfatase A-like enzyme
VTNLITDDALAFLDTHASAPEPFYLSVHYTAPHSPWTGHPQAIVDSYEDCPFDSCPQEPIHDWSRGHGLTESCLGNRDMLKGYFAAVTAMDADVVRLLDRLEALGVRQDTLVVFTSDNGFSCGHHGFWGKGNGTFPLNMFENSVRVPFLVSQPGRVPQNQVESGLFSAYDVFPTLLEHVGLPIPEDDRGRPGRSFAPQLQIEADAAAAAGHEAVVVDASAFAEYGASRMVRTTDWKYVDRGDDLPAELYHLADDPDERVNLAADDGYGRQRRELSGLLGDWFRQHGAGGERDGRHWSVTGAGQLRPVGGRREDPAQPAFAERDQ